jgi:hypothetical protein
MAIPLTGEERVHRCLRDPPIPIIQLVRTFKASLLAPLADRARAAVKLRCQFDDREVSTGWCCTGLVDVCRQLQ